MNLGGRDAVDHLRAMQSNLGHNGWSQVEVAVAPPFTSIEPVATALESLELAFGYGAQDISPFDQGAYTGDISWGMLRELGCALVLVGHSERREHHGEDDDVVRDKGAAAIRNGLTPVICVGEGLRVRRQGAQVDHCVAQLEQALAGLTAVQVRRCVLAYEPIWAIGTGQVARPEDAQEACASLRGFLNKAFGLETAQSVRILYGGSVKSDNFADIVAQPDVDGGLVGGASPDPDEFTALIRIAAEGLPSRP
jgi:triosephosphate isomerase